MNKNTNIITHITSLVTVALITGFFVTHNAFAASRVKKVEINVPRDTVGSTGEIEYIRVDRVASLEKFFEKYKSPLIGSASTFVAVADLYDIDYRLLPSISCMESTCGKFLIEGSYNPFGWGIHGNNFIAFNSYDEAIQVVGEGLNKGYFSKGFDTIEEIAPIYTPPNPHNWARGVRFFSNQITAIALK